MSYTCRVLCCCLIVVSTLLGCATSKPAKEETQELSVLYDSVIERWPVSVDTLTVKTKAGEGHVLNWGNPDGETVVMLHAAMVTSASWIYQAESLAKDYNVYAIDFIGDVGLSRLYDNEVFPQNGEEVAQWIHEVVSGLQLDSFYLIGASMGGWRSMEYARKYPDNVKKMALIAPVGLNPYPAETMNQFGALFADFNPTNLENFLKWVIGPDRNAQESSIPFLTLGFINGTNNSDNELQTPEQLAEIQCPVLLILAEVDAFVGSPAMAQTAAEAIPDSRTHTLKGAHMIAMEKSQEVNALIVDFLKQ